MVFVPEGIIERIARDNRPLPLDATLKFLAHIVGARIRDRATREKGHGQDSEKKCHAFHGAIIKKPFAMATFIPPEELLGLYASGWFPMTMDDGSIRCFSPDPRGIIPLDAFHIPHGTKKTLQDPKWEVRTDTAFERVIRACGQRHDTWIDETIVQSYLALHHAGHAHSLEIWRDGKLAGGLYGVRLGGAFFGESMFHKVTGASKVALVRLVERLKAHGFTLLDTQWTTPHLQQFGAVEVPRNAYLARLAQSIKLPDRAF